MNRKKKEKTLHRKERNMYVLDLFVRVPPNVTAPSESLSTTAAQLFDGRRSERGRQAN